MGIGRSVENIIKTYGTEKSKSGFSDDFRNKEKDFYDKEKMLRLEDVIDDLENAKDTYTDDKKSIEGKLNLYKGLRAQRDANLRFGFFQDELLKYAEARGKEASKISRKEAATVFENFKFKDEIIKNENDALTMYYDAANNKYTFEGSRRIIKNDINLLGTDIEYRQAQRINNENEREEALVKVDNDYKKIINTTETKGIQAEIGLIRDINDWAKREGVDHLMQAYHAQPLTDKRKKIDVELNSLGDIVNLSEKSIDDEKGYDDNAVEYNEAQAEKKIKQTTAKVITFNNNAMTQREYLEEQKRDGDISGEDIRAAKSRITSQQNETLGNINEKYGGLRLINEILYKENNEGEDPISKIKITKNRIFRYCQIPELKELGVLLEDISAVGIENAKLILLKETTGKKCNKEKKLKLQEIIYKKMQANK